MASTLTKRLSPLAPSGASRSSLADKETENIVSTSLEGLLLRSQKDQSSALGSKGGVIGFLKRNRDDCADSEQERQAKRRKLASETIARLKDAKKTSFWSTAPALLVRAVALNTLEFSEQSRNDDDLRRLISNRTAPSYDQIKTFLNLYWAELAPSLNEQNRALLSNELISAAQQCLDRELTDRPGQEQQQQTTAHHIVKASGAAPPTSTKDTSIGNKTGNTHNTLVLLIQTNP
jgi:hypothetical protein